MRTNFSVPSSEAAEVAKETGAKIVLSSDWRSLAETNEVLKQVLRDRPEWVGRRG